METNPQVEHPADAEVLGLWFADVEQHQVELNRQAARRAGVLADAVGFARRHPDIYALPGDTDAVGTAEQCAVTEAGLRLQLSENTIRNLVFTADTARLRLPALWQLAWEGLATLAQIDATLALLPRFDVLPADTRAAAVAGFDDVLADLAVSCSPAQFRSKARRLAGKLAPVDPVTEYADAFTQRRVYIEPVEAGMAWIHLLTATEDARAIMRRATSTAKNMAKRAHNEHHTDTCGGSCESTDGARDSNACHDAHTSGRCEHAGCARDTRTRDQIRADLTTAWLKGIGTPTAVKTKVYVTIPADVLTAEAQASVRRDLPVPAGAPDLNEAPRLDTGETIDKVTAIRMLLKAGSFTRVITDPITGAILDMDRKSRVATRQQREWLLLTHATCTRDGCNHHAAEADIDHWNAYHGPGRGPTNLENLHPFCSADNQTKEKTKLRYRRRTSGTHAGTVQLESPTGFTTRPPREPRPGELEARALLERLRSGTTPTTPLPDNPPF